MLWLLLPALTLFHFQGRTDPEIADDTCWGLPGGLTDASGNVAKQCCCFVDDEPTVNDDATFLRNVAATVVQSMPTDTSGEATIDATRIYMAGHSNGCMASIAMATLNSDVVAAVGCHAGAAIAPFPDEYTATPIMMIHGTLDEDVSYNGSDLYLSTSTAYSLIADANGCNANSEMRKEDASTNNYTTYTSSLCTDNSTVVLVALDDVGHNPYEGFENVAPLEEGTVPTKIDTTQIAWEFVSAHSSTVAPELKYDGLVVTTDAYGVVSSSIGGVVVEGIMNPTASPVTKNADAAPSPTARPITTKSSMAPTVSPVSKTETSIENPSTASMSPTAEKNTPTDPTSSASLFGHAFAAYFTTILILLVFV